MSPISHRHLAVPLLALVLLASACSDDDADLDVAACDAYADVSGAFLGDPAEVPDILTGFEAAMPESLRDDATAYADAMSAAFDGDEAALSSASFTEASDAIGSVVFESCEAAARMEVDGIDFGYEGIPEQIEAGRVAIHFTNETDMGEAHEMFIARKADGVQDSVSELLTLAEDELMSKLIPTAVVFSDTQGSEATSLVEVPAGDYVVFCMIPTGGDGPPHTANGMTAEFSAS